ncbi:MAG: sigma-70 family RNA polymerase sigma factor [Deltaproteobacteria bacterium]|nr:sigma-70 family RNA polymerase sigma factor [Deltaproteobacteria bacterium]
MTREEATAERVREQADDLRLARAAAAGDEEARREIVLRLMDRVRNVARCLLRDEADAEDAAQGAMIAVLRTIGLFRGDGTLQAWATRIAVRTALAAQRRSRQRAERVLSIDGRDVSAVPSPPDPSPEDGMDGLALRRAFVRCLDELPPKRRVVVVLRLVHEMRLDEIAEETGDSVNTVKDRLRVGRQELRRAALEDPLLCEYLKERMP